MVSFQKTAVVSVEMASEDHRQDTAACVSLSRSTISKTRTGGFPVPPLSARQRRRRRISRLGFPCQAVLPEEKPSFPDPRPEETSGAAGAASLKRPVPRVNQTFRTFSAASKSQASETALASPGSRPSRRGRNRFDQGRGDYAARKSEASNFFHFLPAPLTGVTPAPPPRLRPFPNEAATYRGPVRAASADLRFLKLSRGASFGEPRTQPAAI